MPEKEFIVYHLYKDRWVESIDPSDGSTEYTDKREDARIFRGATWLEVWLDRPKYRIDLLGTPPTAV